MVHISFQQGQLHHWIYTRVGGLCGNRLHYFVTQALAEAVEDAENQSGGHQADEGDTQGELLNHQQIDAQGEGAEVDETEDTYQEAREGVRRPHPALLHRQVAGQRVQAGWTVEAHHVQHAHGLRGLRLPRDLHDGDHQTVRGAVRLLPTGAALATQAVGRQHDFTRGYRTALPGSVLVCQQGKDVAVVLQEPDFLLGHGSLMAAKGAAYDAG